MPFLIFFAYIFIEIALFAGIGGNIGVLPTLIWTALGFVIGASMIRRGGETSRKWLEKARAGTIDTGIGDQIFWFIGGLLVILPGFLTDFIGILLVLPPTRAMILWLWGRIMPQSTRQSFTFVQENNFSQDPNEGIIEGEIIDDQNDNRNGGS